MKQIFEIIVRMSYKKGFLGDVVFTFVKNMKVVLFIKFIHKALFLGLHVIDKIPASAAQKYLEIIEKEFIYHVHILRIIICLSFLVPISLFRVELNLSNRDLNALKAMSWSVKLHLNL